MQRTAGEVVVVEDVVTDGVGLTLQDAWVQHATLRDNILFGRLFDSEKYAAVIGACALQQDIKVCIQKQFYYSISRAGVVFVCLFCKQQVSDNIFICQG